MQHFDWNIYCSGYSKCEMVWNWGRLQCHGFGFIRAQLRGPVQFLQSQIHTKDGAHASRSIGIVLSLQIPKTNWLVTHNCQRSYLNQCLCAWRGSFWVYHYVPGHGLVKTMKWGWLWDSCIHVWALWYWPFSWMIQCSRLLAEWCILWGHFLAAFEYGARPESNSISE